MYNFNKKINGFVIFSSVITNDYQDKVCGKDLQCIILTKKINNLVKLKKKCYNFYKIDNV